MRLPHKGGEEMEVDYAGMTLPITNPETGEISQAQVFVAVLPASSYTYVEIQSSQELPHWLGGHVRGFEFFGGVPKILRPDNLKSGVKHPTATNLNSIPGLPGTRRALSDRGSPSACSEAKRQGNRGK